MPELVRLYLHSIVTGFVISALFAAGLIWLDVAGIGHLILGSDIGWIAALMLVALNGIIFSAVQFGYRIMAMAEPDSGPDNRPFGGHPAREPVPVPVHVRAQRRERRLK
jgi:hypothetical protein